MKTTKTWSVMGLVVAASVCWMHGGRAAELPKATQEVLKALKVDASVLSGLDQELAVPKSWLEKANKQGVVKLIGNYNRENVAAMTAPFRERYPSIRIDYVKGTRQQRSTNILVAFKSGHFPVDVANNLGAALSVFRAEGVLDDLRILPSFKNLEPVMRDDKGIWVAYRQQYWCLAYNTKLIKEADLPQKWEDILSNPKLQGKNLAIGNRANLWMYMLWAYHGEDWTTKYIKRLFNEVKPQLRKEGVGAMVSLLAIGEFAATIPASGPHVERVREKGGPVGYHCPEPVPVSYAAAGIIKGNPHIDASRIYLNWLLSKEGQLSQFLHVGDSVPVHRDLQRKEFGVMQNKKVAGRSDDTLTTIGPKVDKVWDSNWR